MKIWITEIGEPLPLEKDARLHRYGILTKEFVTLGHEVVWWTSSFSHSRKQFVRDADCEESVDGVTLRIIHGPGYDRNISFQRLKHQAHFAKRFYELAQEYDRPDIIITPIPTLEVAESAVKLGSEHSITVLLDIRDEWPEVLVDLAPRLLRPFARLVLNGSFRRMSYVCRNASGILAISQSYLDHALRYAGRKKGPRDGVFPHGYSANAQDLKKVEAAKKWWARQGVRESAFICCFFGTIGKYFNLSTVIEAARILSRELDVQFVICGDGSRLAYYKELASDVPSVIFPGWVDGPQISALMGLSNVGLAPYIANARMSLPNKPFEYFAGGLPVVSTLTGELESLLSQNRCGLTYDANSVKELTSILRELHKNPGQTLKMGRNARALLESEFTVEQIAKRMSDHFNQVIDLFKSTRS